MSLTSWLRRGLCRALGLTAAAESARAEMRERYQGMLDRIEEQWCGVLKRWAESAPDQATVMQRIEELSATLQGRLREVTERLDGLTAMTQDIQLSGQDAVILRSGCLPAVTGPRAALETAHPVAWDSDDHKHPCGAAHDSTRSPRFCRRCEQLFGRKVSLLDLGCSGGGLVWDFLLRGHSAVGLEGSDFSERNQRAAWRLVPGNLFTCDVTKPFQLSNSETGQPLRFDVISAWEVLEHIPEADLPGLFANIRNHLGDEGLFVASVATFEHGDSKVGATYHVTVKERPWWLERLREYGFEMVDVLFEPADFARGSGNIYNCHDWSVLTNPEMGFHIVAQPLDRAAWARPQTQFNTEASAAVELPSFGLPNSMVSRP